MRWLWRTAESSAPRVRRVRLPPLWLFGALAAILLMMAAPKDIGDVFEYHCYALDFWQGAHVANTALATPCFELQDSRSGHRSIPGVAARVRPAIAAGVLAAAASAAGLV